MPTIRFRLNGAEIEIDAASDRTLLDLLRGELGLRGSHFGCGANECGACHVMVGDRAVAEDGVRDLLLGQAVEGVVAVINTAAGVLDHGIAAAGGPERVRVAGDQARWPHVLQEGQAVQFNVVKGPKGWQASDVQPL